MPTVLLPTVSEPLLPSQVPHVDIDFAFANASVIKANRWNGIFVELPSRQRVSQCSFTCVLEADYADFKLAAPQFAVDPAHKLLEIGNHFLEIDVSEISVCLFESTRRKNV